MKRKIYLGCGFLLATALLTLILGGLASSSTRACEPGGAGNPPGPWTKGQANPILSEGNSGEWDAGGVGSPAVSEWKGTCGWWFMLYMGLGEGETGDYGTGFGHAFGPGLTSWNKGDGSRVLQTGDAGDWDSDRIFAPTVLYDQQEGYYKMWYSGRDATGTWRIGYATLPSLSAGEWEKYDNNPVLGPGYPSEWDGKGVRSPVVIKEKTPIGGTSIQSDVGPSCVYTYTYKMWYAGQDAAGVWRIGYATSTDGTSWAKYEGNPVLEPGVFGSWDENGVMAPFVIERENRYEMFYVGMNAAWTKRIGYALSNDGVVWTKLYARNPMLGPGDTDDWDSQAVDEPAVIYSGKYKMFYAGQDTAGTWRIGYASAYPKAMTESNDLAVDGNDIWTLPASIHAGDLVTVGVNVHNLWKNPRPDVEVHFYDGNPDLGGTLICTATTSPIPPFSVRVAWKPNAWDTTGLSGIHKLYAKVDPDGKISEDNEENNVAWREVNFLPLSSDITPPTGVITINEGAEITYATDVTITLDAQDDTGVVSMYIVEVQFVYEVGRWVPVKQLGWIPYTTPYTWTLSSGAGAKYPIAYFADIAGNVSLEPAWDIINYIPAGGETLGPEDVQVYRMEFTPGITTTLIVSPTKGDADLYVWKPGNWAGPPDYASNHTGTVQEAVVINNTLKGIYHIEVHNPSASDPAHYTFRLEEGAVSSSAGWKAAQGDVGILQAPEAPVTAEKPEEERMALPPITRHYLYLPVVLRGGS